MRQAVSAAPANGRRQTFEGVLHQDVTSNADIGLVTRRLFQRRFSGVVICIAP